MSDYTATSVPTIAPPSQPIRSRAIEQHWTRLGVTSSPDGWLKKADTAKA